MQHLQRTFAAFSVIIAILLPMGASAVAPSISFDEEVQFNGGELAYNVASQKIDATHIIVAYSSGNEGDGVASIGTIDGDTVTFGPTYEFVAGSIRFVDIAMIDATHALIVYSDSGNGDHGTAVVATIAGTSISFGTPVEFETSGSITDYETSGYLAILDSTHFALAYAVESGIVEMPQGGYVVAGTISGTDITFGSPIEYTEQASFQDVEVLDSSRFVLTYQDAGSNKAVIGTVDGTSITLGTPIVTTTANVSNNVVVAFSESRIILAFSNGDEVAVMLIVGTVADTSITLGTPFFISDLQTTSLSFSTLDETNAVLIYNEFLDGGRRGKGVVITLDGTTGSVSDEAVFFDTGLAMYSNVLTIDRDTVLAFTTDEAADYEGYYAFGTVTLPASSSSSSSSSQSSSAEPRSQGGGRRGSPGRGGVAKPLSTLREERKHAAAAATDFEQRTCDRVLKWFKNDAKMLGRVNERLQKRFGFTCRE